jgi:cytochrome c peroxidase
VPVPQENPITEEKRVLGKILFWDEQLSSDNSMACGTCHIPAFAGADPNIAINPGFDGVFGTADDVLGSPGVVRRNGDGDPIEDPIFGFDRQVTGRAAPSYFASMFAPELFWDGRASNTFVDPLDGQTVAIAQGGALESQAVGPILSHGEMAKDGRTWSEVTDKLASSTPLALGTDLPPDVAAAIASAPSYPNLFAAAFGDSSITPVRIAFAIATYERTLVADETPWDLFIAGQTNALTPNQQRGWDLLRNQTLCTNCHRPPLFTDNQFHNIGLRPAIEDTGRMAVTNDQRDFGRFKTPSLRNVGLKSTLMHVGWVTDVADAIDFYIERGGHDQFTQDQSGVPTGQPGQFTSYDNIRVPQTDQNGQPFRAFVIDFLQNGLTDPRVANETFPFDRPTLMSEQPVGNDTPEIRVTPSPVDFSDVVEGAIGRRTIIVSNIGDGVLDGTLSTQSPFFVEGPGTYSIASGASVVIGIAFSPPAVGDYGSTIEFTGDDSASVPVTGTCIAAPTPPPPPPEDDDPPIINPPPVGPPPGSGCSAGTISKQGPGDIAGNGIVLLAVGLTVIAMRKRKGELVDGIRLKSVSADC